MKRCLVVIVLGIGTAGPSWAVDIAGKWGIGAGVFAGGGEVSLMRGHSQRTAWLLEVALFGSNENNRTEYNPPVGSPPPAVESNRSSFSVAVGPGLRRYSRPESEFSPYFDASVRGIYQRYHATGNATFSRLGTSLGFGLGVEYFTRWQFSVAADAPLLDVSWTRDRRDFGDGLYVERNGEIRASIGVRPALFVRGYF